MKEKPWHVEKSLLVENVFDGVKVFPCEKLPWWRKNLGLWKPSLMNEFVETFLDERNIYAWGKCSWWRKNLGLWKKTSLIKENSLLVENLFDEGKTLACWKLPWRTEYLCLGKTFLIKEKSWLVENFVDGGKVFACEKHP